MEGLTITRVLRCVNGEIICSGGFCYKGNPINRISFVDNKEKYKKGDELLIIFNSVEKDNFKTLKVEKIKVISLRQLELCHQP